MSRSHLVTLGGLTPPVDGPDTANWFVSRSGNNTAGTSWATAWTDLDQIVWASVQPGDTIAVDGGSTRVSAPQGYDFANHATARPGLTAGMLYTGALVPSKSGTAGNPITIRASNEAGRDGTVVLFGGRASLLPEAGSTSYTVSGTGNGTAINLNSRSYITIDGLHRSGIMVYGWGAAGLSGNGNALQMNAATDHVTVRNMEIFDCGTYGTYTLSAGGTAFLTDQEGITLGGSNVTLDRLLVHDCGQDPIQGASVTTNLAMSNVWSYYRRQHSTWTGYGFNAGSQAIADQNTTHVDGIQVYGGNSAVPHQGPATFDHCIFGPMVNQGIYLGDGSIGNSFDNVSISHTTVLAPFRHGIIADTVGTSGTPSGWSIDHVTVHGPSTAFGGFSSGWGKFDIAGVGHTITNTVTTWAGYFNGPGFTGSGNVYSGGDPVPGGTSLDPLFTNGLTATNNAPTFAQYLALNLTPTAAGAVGKGSSVTSIQTLLDRIDALNGG